jgi:hypothetical protein
VPPTAPVREAALARKAEVEASLTALKERSAKLSRARGLLFLVAAGVGAAGAARGLPAAGWAFFAVIVLAFVALVVRHAFVATDELRAAERLKIIEGTLKRLDGDLEDDAEPGERFRPTAHPYADDLDLFGPRSLFRTVCRARTGFGQSTLARWLLAPADAKEVAARQAAVRELADRPQVLEELAVAALRADAKGRDAEPLVIWAGEAPAIDVPGARRAGPAGIRRVLVRAGRVLVPVTLLALLASRVLAASHPVVASLWVVPLILQCVALAILYGPVSRLVHAVSSREQPFGRYRALFQLVESTTWSTPELEARAAILRRGGSAGRPASEEIAALERVVGFADLRHNTVVHLIANILLLWDLWCAIALERWRDRCGGQVLGWLAALGEIEALASLATLARERPTWSLPEVAEGPPHLEAEGLGHPLIAPDRRVENDVKLVSEPGIAAGPPGHGLLVTGSNMSGKSTYLRSIGLCAVLALAGGPVCARRAALSPLRTWTSMRIRDDLADGVSHFYAELRRLKEVVDATADGADVLFLLDEILHGTNSRERVIGARTVVASLVARGAIGAVSSHDLGLADLETRTAGRVKNVHFRETVEGDVMTFDYRLREGVVDTSNALRLMRGVGLEVSLD